jgi:hypothetical protein
VTEDGLRELEANQRRANPHESNCCCIICCRNGYSEEAKKKAAARVIAFEAEIERTCTNILIHDGWRALKTDPVSDRRRGKGFGELGMADYLYLRYWLPHMRPIGEIMWIEWKRRTESGADTKAAAHQKEWHEQERLKGAMVLVAGEDFPATVVGFCAWYEKSGLKRG